MQKIYDVLILGGGVAGMSAAIYAKRSGADVAIIEKTALLPPSPGTAKVSPWSNTEARVTP